MMTTASRSRLFITGTDTEVGKTHVTCLIAAQLIERGFRVGAYKPVCSGAIPWEPGSSAASGGSTPRWEDIERLHSATRGEWSRELICPQRFLAPLAPPIAARSEGKTVDFQRSIDGANQFGDVDCLLIEGVGGWLSPFTETRSVADYAQALDAPVLIVARPGLGTINHTLLTIESIRARNLTVVGVVLNHSCNSNVDESVATNPEEIEARSGAPVFGTIAYGNRAELHRNGKQVTINWHRLDS